MAENKLKHPPKTQKATGGKSLFARLDGLVSMQGMFAEGLPVKYAPKILFVTFMGMLYIWNTHYSDRIARRSDQLKKEVQDLRYDYTTLKEGYMFDSKQSEVAKRVSEIGLREGTQPPYKLVVSEREY